MVIKKLIDSIQDDWKTEYDEQIFSLLLRTLKETGYVCKYYNFSTIVNRCYLSRNTFVLKSHYESLWKNISLWMSDITKSEGCLKGDIDSFDRLHLSFIWKITIINKMLSKYNIYDREFFNHFFRNFYNFSKHVFSDRYKKRIDLDSVYKALEYCDKILKYKNGYDDKIARAHDIINKIKQHYENTKSN